jgi:DHA1 family bicyclomycin/chloramphenicol resistance-like MFS transporter
MVTAGTGGLLATALGHLPLAAMVVSLFTMVSGVAVTTPPSTSLALEHHPDVAGSASSLLGLARFAFGGVAAPLVGLAGPDTAVPLGVVAVAAALAALGGYGLVRRATSPERVTAA